MDDVTASCYGTLGLQQQNAVLHLKKLSEQFCIYLQRTERVLLLGSITKRVVGWANNRSADMEEVTRTPSVHL